MKYNNILHVYKNNYSYLNKKYIFTKRVVVQFR